MSLSRRALLSAVFPVTPADRGASLCTDGQHPQLIASISGSNACVERQGITCRRCSEVCTLSAIRIIGREGRGAVIDAGACTGCGDCVPVCPVEAITLVPRARVELASELARMVAAHG